ADGELRELLRRHGAGLLRVGLGCPGRLAHGMPPGGVWDVRFARTVQCLRLPTPCRFLPSARPSRAVLPAPRNLRAPVGAPGMSIARMRPVDARTPSRP